MQVEIPDREMHEGFHRMTVEIADNCPQCGAQRGTRRWRGFSYDGSRRMEVDCWQNECDHVDKYSAVRAEIATAHDGHDHG